MHNDNSRLTDGSSPSPKRRRLYLNPPLHAADPSSIVVAEMQNESDALHILALASGQVGDKGGVTESTSRREKRLQDHNQHGESLSHTAVSEFTSKRPTPSSDDLGDFALVKLGIVTEKQAIQLADAYFKYHHHIFVSLAIVVGLS
jgi:hypothetical protein